MEQTKKRLLIYFLFIAAISLIVFFPSFYHQNRADQLQLFVETADIYTLKYSQSGYSHLYTNEGGMFTDITHQTPLESIENVSGIRSFNMVFADYDNDGDKDLSISTNEAIHLLRNDNNFFTDVSEEMGFVGHIPPGFIIVWHYCISGWADYDSDGDLD